MLQKLLSMLIPCIIFSKVIIPVGAISLNEIYPVPATGQSEWIELYNDSEISYDLTNHILKDAANTFIPLPSSIPPHSYITIESANVLNNSGDTIIFMNGTATIEIATYSSGLTSTKSYIKCPDGTANWTTGDILTKNSTNTPACPQPSPTPTITPTPLPTATPTLTPSPTPTTSPITNIYLSEVMTYPSSGLNEWVELYNDNNYEIILVDWYIDDSADSGASPKSFTTTLPPKGYGVVEFDSSLFNNGGDEVRLLDGSETLVDIFIYEVSERNFSIAIEKNTLCIQTPTKGFVNSGCLQSTISVIPTVTPKYLSTPISSTIVPPKISPVSLPTISPTPPFISHTSNPTVQGSSTKAVVKNRTQFKKIDVKSPMAPPHSSTVKTLTISSLLLSLASAISIALKASALTI